MASPKTVLAPQPCAVCVLLHLNSKGLHEDRGGFFHAVVRTPMLKQKGRGKPLPTIGWGWGGT